ncbi:hypothetical protein GF325_18060 [Candidatus Bathyarchaeota archaeon]|nr:hypothetical protein [Candidatus Bathyarchaeota archaeon]
MTSLRFFEMFHLHDLSTQACVFRADIIEIRKNETPPTRYSPIFMLDYANPGKQVNRFLLQFIPQASDEREVINSMATTQENIRNIWINGCSCCDTCTDDDGDMVSIVFDIPGVAKDKIDLRVVPEGLRLEAWRDATTRYVSEYAFLCPAKSKEAKATYINGELTVQVPLECKDPYKDAGRIPIA